MEYKQCPRCKETLELTTDTWYRLRGRRGDGWSGYCKDCTKALASKKYPTIITIQSLQPGRSILASLALPTRRIIQAAKGPVYIHIRDTDTYRSLKDLGNEELTYSGLLDDLHSQGYTIKEAKLI